MGSFVVIRFSLDNRAGTIDLLGEDDTYHLVGEGHSGKRYLTICPGIDGIAEAVGTADDKDQLTGYALAVLHPGCELDGAVFLAMLIHQNDGIRGLELLEDEFSLTFLLLRLAHTFCVFQFRNDTYVEWHVVGDACGILIEQGFQMFVHRLAYKD